MAARLKRYDMPIFLPPKGVQNAIAADFGKKLLRIKYCVVLDGIARDVVSSRHKDRRRTI